MVTEILLLSIQAFPLTMHIKCKRTYIRLAMLSILTSTFCTILSALIARWIRWIDNVIIYGTIVI